MPRPCMCDRFVLGKAYRLDQCRRCWLFAHSQKFRDLWSDGKAGLATKAPQETFKKVSIPKRRSLCIHIGKRIEFMVGCGGWKCKHECLNGHPYAIPGENCQTCPDWEAD